MKAFVGATAGMHLTVVYKSRCYNKRVANNPSAAAKRSCVGPLLARNTVQPHRESSLLDLVDDDPSLMAAFGIGG
jgi:hypothetical protein